MLLMVKFNFLLAGVSNLLSAFQKSLSFLQPPSTFVFLRSFAREFFLSGMCNLDFFFGHTAFDAWTIALIHRRLQQSRFYCHCSVCNLRRNKFSKSSKNGLLNFFISAGKLVIPASWKFTSLVVPSPFNSLSISNCHKGNKSQCLPVQWTCES